MDRRAAAGLLLLVIAGLIGLLSGQALGDTAAAQTPQPPTTTSSTSSVTTSATTSETSSAATTASTTTSASTQTTSTTDTDRSSSTTTSATTTISSSSSSATATESTREPRRPDAQERKKDGKSKEDAYESKADSAKEAKAKEDAKQSKADSAKEGKGKEDAKQSKADSAKEGAAAAPTQPARAQPARTQDASTSKHTSSLDKAEAASMGHESGPSAPGSRDSGNPAPGSGATGGEQRSTDSTASPEVTASEPTVAAAEPSRVEASAVTAGGSSAPAEPASSESVLTPLAEQNASLPTPATHRARPPLRQLHAFPARFVNRPGLGRRQGTMLSFVLSAPARVRFTVLGEAPACRPLGTFSMRGHRGMNRMRFLGRLRGRRLPPGTYTIIPRIARRGQQRALASIAVEIVSTEQPPAAATARVRPECPRPSAFAALPTQSESGADSAFIANGVSVGASQVGVGAKRGTAASGVATQAAAATDERPLARVPVLSDLLPDEAPVPPTTLAVLALAAVGLGSLVLIMLVLRFFQRGWNP
jgi:hypothetical protein